jgi:nitrogen fixation/metabolism regulation signal transduction histidine kinase
VLRQARNRARHRHHRRCRGWRADGACAGAGGRQRPQCRSADPANDPDGADLDHQAAPKASKPRIATTRSCSSVAAGLKQIYTLTLTLALLLALFAAIALAFLLAERLARPLLILAEGTQAVAAGDFTPRATVEASDELGVLTHSFNSMTQQLGEARAQAEHHRAETEAAQAYLESVLANLSAGVLAFDLRFRLRAANRGALAILGDDLAGFEQMRLQDWPRHESLAGEILEGFARRGGEWQQQLELARPDGMAQALLVRGKALPAGGGGGYVVVFDDITRLIAAQRSAAWGEVAQRLAHEIKNPLTPIQLSAERLQMKLADQLSGPSRELLDRATQTIVNQVEAMKNMVNDFRDYARTPLPQLAAVDLPALLGEVLDLYHQSRAVIAVDRQRRLRACRAMLADANQLRQVLHNVLTNAQDALAEIAEPKITIAIAQRCGPHAADGARQRPGLSAADPVARLRALCHDQGQGHRPRPGHRQEDRRRPRRRDSPGQRSRRRSQHLAAAGGRGSRGSSAARTAAPWPASGGCRS